jgi:hypothetical protein
MNTLSRYRIVRAPACIVFAFALAMLVAALDGAEDTLDLRRTFDIPAGSAEKTFKQFAAQAGGQLAYATDLVQGIRTNAIRGEYPPFAALEKMIAGTPLIVVRDGRPDAFAIRRGNDPKIEGVAPGIRSAALVQDPIQLNPFVVTTNRDLVGSLPPL